MCDCACECEKGDEGCCQSGHDGALIEMSPEQRESFDEVCGIVETQYGVLARTGLPEMMLALAFIEVSVNEAVDTIGHKDVIAVLRDLANQIEADCKDLEAEACRGASDVDPADRTGADLGNVLNGALPPV